MRFLFLTMLLALAGWISPAGAAPPDDVQTLELTVDGVPRTALVHVPPAAAPGSGAKLPLVFVFHGHGGRSRQAMRAFGFDHLWPEAISVYPQGLPTPGKLTDPDGKLAGWQNTPGGQDDRDLHFFDALLARLEADHPVDEKRIYVTGHSNGAGFTYLLWWQRPSVFAAVAACSGAAIYAPLLTPKPAMILGGRADPIVKFEWQERMMAAVRQVNGCEAAGTPWADGKATLYPSKGGTPLVTYVYDGGHMMERDESALVAKFFQEHPPAVGP